MPVDSLTPKVFNTSSSKYLGVSAHSLPYQLLALRLRRLRANPDDQIETMVMRLDRGSSLLGAAGIPPLRRWGMGTRRSYLTGHGWAGTQGMKTWLARPLLPIHKDRILATCEDNGLPYSIDVTNFQPCLTPRNAIRTALSSQGNLVGFTSSPTLNTIKARLDPDSWDCDQVLEQLSASNIKELGAIQYEATRFLRDSALDSPPSTVFIRSNLPRPPEIVQVAIILRLLRFVSPHPWGSLSAEVHRRSRSLARIKSQIFSSTPVVWSSCKTPPSSSHLVPSNPPSFTAGSGVAWTPSIMQANGSVHRIQGARTTPNSVTGWLVHRLTPPSMQRLLKHAGSITFLTNSNLSKGGHIRFAAGDVVPICSGCHTQGTSLEILFDCRFTININVNNLTRLFKHDYDLKLRVGSHGPYHLPALSVVRRIGGGDEKEDLVWALPDQSNQIDADYYHDDWLYAKSARTLAEL